MTAGAAGGPALTLYGRAWCHLCDEMRDAVAPLVAEYCAVLTEIDVDGDPALDARFGERVPVLLLGDAELCHYRCDEARVRAALAAWEWPVSKGVRLKARGGKGVA